MINCSPKLLQRALLKAFLSGALSVICFLVFTNMAFTRADVQNTSDLKAFSTRELPGFVHQRQDSESLKEFRQFINFHLREEKHSPLETAIAVRKWVRDQQSDSPDAWRAPYLDDSEDPKRLLEELHHGFRSACRRLSYILVGSLLSVGLEARVVYVGENFKDSGLNHTMVEVWIDGLKKWVLIDATFDTLILIDGVPASLVEVYFAAKSPTLHQISFQRDGSQHVPAPKWETYERVFKHIFIARTNAIFDGYRVALIGSRRISFLHLVDASNEPYPQRIKQMACGLWIVFTCASLILLCRFLVGVCLSLKAQRSFSPL
jgi:hypothetical protein